MRIVRRIEKSVRVAPETDIVDAIGAPELDRIPVPVHVPVHVQDLDHAIVVDENDAIVDEGMFH